MSRCLQGLAATLVAAALIFGQAAPSGAAAGEFENRGEVGVLFDAIVLRPMGLAVTALGGMLFAFPVGPIVAITRPADIHKPLEALVLRPVRYTFVDPLGHH